MATPDNHTDVRRQSAGALTLFLGIGLLVLILLDATYGLPWALPPTWYLHRTLWGAVALALCAMGWILQRGQGGRGVEWKPKAPGRRFRKLIVYSRADCHLCDDAKAVLAEYLEYLPPIEEVDIDADPALKAQFDTMVPVVELDGVVRFSGRVDEILLRRLIDGTPPLNSLATNSSERSSLP
jgi:glutaredoxin